MLTLSDRETDSGEERKMDDIGEENMLLADLVPLRCGVLFLYV